MSTSTPQERVRASIVLTHSERVGEMLLQAIKANPAFKLSDLHSDDERAIFVEAALAFLLDPIVRTELVSRLNELRAHGRALEDDESEAVNRRARSDVAHFGPVRPGHCLICRERVITNKVTVLITDNLSADAHGLCCAQDESRYARVEDFLYRVREAN